MLLGYTIGDRCFATIEWRNIQILFEWCMRLVEPMSVESFYAVRFLCGMTSCLRKNTGLLDISLK